MLPWLGLILPILGSPPAAPHSVWLEAESLGPLRGSNFSFMKAEKQARGSWALAGPDVAAAWTQGGESEFMSVAARADEAAGVAIGREIELPAAGAYRLWVRYADYRGKEEAFGVRIRQGRSIIEHVFGRAPVVDELDPMKLLWDWSFGWDNAGVMLAKGPARVELFTTGPTGARRQVDCLCLTTDPGYHPAGREKPDAPAWRWLRAESARIRAGTGAALPLPAAGVPPEWKIADGPPAFVWNVGDPWMQELKRPLAGRVDAPFGVDPPLEPEFLAAFRGKQPPIYGDSLSGPVWHIRSYPAAFATGSPFLHWLDRHPRQRFAILLNYGEPSWPPGADRAAVRANLRRYADRFAGFIAGESVSYDDVDQKDLERRVGAAHSRAEVLAVLRELHTAATVRKFGDVYGATVTPAEAWGPVISCLSASMEAYCHALCDWGVRRIGHENTGNSPTLARRLAFLRGAARQFGARVVDYQSANLGDAATMFSRQAFFYPGSSRYVLDNQYDVWAGAGVNWLLKDYLLFHVAGVDAFYNEQGVDLFWKPGGNSAGDDFPIQLSPKGKVAEAVQRLAREHPRGTQYTPVAFLLDEAHGWAQERFQPGAFGLDPQWNPAVLTPGRHEAALRGWFDVAYYPAPETQNEPASAVRQTYVSGTFGELFDVIVNAPGRTAIARAYPVLIAAGEVPLSQEWGKALRDYVQQGGTLVACAGTFSGPGARELPLSAAAGPLREAGAFTWTATGSPVASNVYHYQPLDPGGQTLAAAPDRSPVAVRRPLGKGSLIEIAVPLGLGIDDRPVPLLALLMRESAIGLAPISVAGDVEWALNRLDDGGWLVTLLNNHGVIKPQHGVLPTDHHAAQRVTLRTGFRVKNSREWLTESAVGWETEGRGSKAEVTVPAGGVRMVEVHAN